MPLKPVKAGSDMYQGWITHTHSHLGGACPHACSYCYVQRNRFGVPARYQGEPRLIESELAVNYGSGKTIFIEHMNDMFAEGIKDEWIKTILNHCKKYPNNTYVFQTKNPRWDGMEYLIKNISSLMIGTTIETNRDIPSLITKAPQPLIRLHMFKALTGLVKTFITLEPLMNCDVDVMAEWLKHIKPSFVNIGADSKKCGLPEPPAEKVRELIARLQEAGLTIKEKSNLKRLLI